jgi:hypothetical protein
MVKKTNPNPTKEVMPPYSYSCIYIAAPRARTKPAAAPTAGQGLGSTR